MIKRPEKRSFFRAPSHEINVKLASGETPEARFKQWLAQDATPPGPCHKHPKTKLTLDAGRTRFWPADESSGRLADPACGEFNFYAEFRCPACHVAAAHCPPEFHETSFGTFDTSTQERAEMLARSREFVAQVNRRGSGFALLVGPTGPGKTRLACNIVRELDEPEALYVRQGELTTALRATYGRKSVEYDGKGHVIEKEGPLEICQNVRFLVLDEIGCTALANDERLLLDELIKSRYEARKPSTLISNLPLTGKPEAPGLKEFLGDALSDRIRHATGNGKFILQFTGESYRRQSGESYLDGPR